MSGKGPSAEEMAASPDEQFDPEKSNYLVETDLSTAPSSQKWQGLLLIYWMVNPKSQRSRNPKGCLNRP
jgi:hypothetical protein